MKVFAINGSPRKDKNTATLLTKALEGAASKGAETELIHLYEHNYKGCKSCFACKYKNGNSYGKCALQDDLAPIFEKISKADALIFGSPIYLGSVTGEMRSFLERLVFQYLDYGSYSSIHERKIPTGFIYTMNVNKDIYENAYESILKYQENFLVATYGSLETLVVNDTYQFHNASQYKEIASSFNEEEKRKVKEEQFPIDCENAFDMGKRFASIH